MRFEIVLLSGFQSDDDKNRPSIHPANTAGVTHEIVQDGCELCAHLLMGNNHVIHHTVVRFCRAVMLV